MYSNKNGILEKMLQLNEETESERLTQNQMEGRMGFSESDPTFFAITLKRSSDNIPKTLVYRLIKNNTPLLKETINYSGHAWTFFSWIPPQSTLQGSSPLLGFYSTRTGRTSIRTTEGKVSLDGFSFQEGKFKRVAFSSEGSRFVRVVDADEPGLEVYEKIKQWQIYRKIMTIKAPGVQSVAFNPRREDVLAYSTDTGSVELRKDSEKQRSFIHEKIVSFSFCPTGNRLALITGEGDVRIHNIADFLKEDETK